MTTETPFTWVAARLVAARTREAPGFWGRRRRDHERAAALFAAQADRWSLPLPDDGARTPVPSAPHDLS